MTLQDWFAAALAQHAESEAAFELRALVEAITGLTPTQQRIKNPNLDDQIIQKLDQNHRRLLAGEPLAYILGNQAFWDITLTVTPDTLIPRPDTETVIERVIAHGKSLSHPTIYDLGTGSGAIAIVLARSLPNAHIVASDISSKALVIAQENAKKFHLENIEFLCGDWLAPFADDSADIIVSNPPYLASDDPHLPALCHEPQQALIAKEAGYHDLYFLIANGWRKLKNQGWLILEHGYQQGEKVRQYAEKSKHYQNIKTHCDRAGRPRFTEMQQKKAPD